MSKSGAGTEITIICCESVSQSVTRKKWFLTRATEARFLLPRHDNSFWSVTLWNTFSVEILSMNSFNQRRKKQTKKKKKYILSISKLYKLNNNRENLFADLKKSFERSRYHILTFRDALVYILLRFVTIDNSQDLIIWKENTK